MWLPRDERHLLLGYYVNIFNVNDRNVTRYLDNPKWFEKQDWADVLKESRWIPILTPYLVKRAALKVKEYGENSNESTQDEKTNNKKKIKQIRNYIFLLRRLEISSSSLLKRNLINIQTQEHDPNVVGISLTIEGQNLGRKYNSWWARTGQWFAEYKDHWFWLILGFLGGIIGALIVNWLSKA
jgi:hypothetical protein